MTSEQIYYSPVICYEVTSEAESYSVNVYYDHSKNSADPVLHCTLQDFSADLDTARRFAKLLADNCALPVHAPELAEEFLSV